MSYSFGMFFKEINEIDILPLFNRLCDIMIENSKEILDNQKYFIPSIRSNKMNEYVDEYWLDTIFSLRFVYWKDKKLLGLLGYDYPKELIGLFDCHVGFQNSTDQDYEYEIWSDKITFFKELKDRFSNITVEELLSYYNNDSYTSYTKEEIENCLDYYKKTFLYDQIYKELDLSNWLYGHNSDKFKRYTINSIDCIEKKLDIQRELKVLLKKLNENYE